MTLAEAIAREEGFGVPNSRSTRNNNPGDLEYGAFAKQYGADRLETPLFHKPARFAHFPSAVEGFAAMRALLKLHYSGLTIKQMLNKYAPPVENDTNLYIYNVCKWTGLTEDTVIDQYL